MFWILLLAHLMADYPLQTDRMVLAKRNLLGLLIHVGIHVVVMMVLLFPVLGIAWPYIVAIAACHFIIDAFKNFLSRRRPQWVVGPYVFDQFLHLGSLILVMSVMDQNTDLPVWPVIAPWSVYLSGLLIVTYIWFLSERIILHNDESAIIAVQSTMWPRMGTRLLLFVLVAAPYSFTLFLALPAVAILFLVYRRLNYLSSWLVIDISVAVITGLLVRAVLWIW